MLSYQVKHLELLTKWDLLILIFYVLNLKIWILSMVSI